jgi:hypothetical protein
MAKTSHKPVGLARLQRQGRGRSRGGRSRPKVETNREERITMEVVVDADDASERATSWFAYLERELEFPFTARCTERRAISPLLPGAEIEVVSMAPADECSHEMFVMIRWEHGGLGVPLSQLEPSGAGASTEIAVADWLYWVGQGYEF